MIRPRASREAPGARVLRHAEPGPMLVERQTSERQNTRVELIMLLLASLACVVVLTASLATGSGPAWKIALPAGTLALAAFIGITGTRRHLRTDQTLRTMPATPRQRRRKRGATPHARRHRGADQG